MYLLHCKNSGCNYLKSPFGFLFLDFKLLEYVHQYITIYFPNEKNGLKWSILVRKTPWFHLDGIKKMYRF